MNCPRCNSSSSFVEYDEMAVAQSWHAHQCGLRCFPYPTYKKWVLYIPNTEYKVYFLPDKTPQKMALLRPIRMRPGIGLYIADIDLIYCPLDWNITKDRFEKIILLC